MAKHMVGAALVVALGGMAFGTGRANAANYCVGTAGAGCTPQTTIQLALNAAKANAGADTVTIGEGDYDVGSGLVYDDPGAVPNPVTVVAADPAKPPTLKTVGGDPENQLLNRTVLTVKGIAAQGSLVRYVKIVLGGAGLKTGIETNGNVEAVQIVDTAEPGGKVGLRMALDNDADEVHITGTSISLSGNGGFGSTGVIVNTETTPTGGLLRFDGTRIDANIGVIVRAAYRVRISRTSVTAKDIGIQAGFGPANPHHLGADVSVDNSDVTMKPGGNLPNRGALMQQSISQENVLGAMNVQRLRVIGATLINDAGAGVSAIGATSVAADVAGTRDTAGIVSVDSTYVDPRFESSVKATGVAGAPSSVDIAYSSIDLAAAKVSQTGAGAVNQGAGNIGPVAVSAAFASPPWVHSTADPLFNKGNPAAPGAPLEDTAQADNTPLASNARVLFGRRDIGATEATVQPPPPLIPPGKPPVTPGTVPVKPKALPKITAKTATMSKSGVVTLTVTCGAGGLRCKGLVSLVTANKVSAAAKKRQVTLGQKRFSVAAGKKAKVRITVKKTTRKLIKRKGLKAIYRIKLDGGATKSGKLTLKPAKK